MAALNAKRTNGELDEAGYQQGLMALPQFVQQAAAMVSFSANSLFETQNSVKLAQLKAQEDSLQQEKGSNETIMKFVEGEYKAAEEGEKAAVQDAVPKFGLG